MKNNTYTLYRLTCRISGKSYIGYTKFTALQRFNKHVGDFKNKLRRLSEGLPIRRFRILENAFQKYGTCTNVWSVETLISKIPTKEEAKAMEIEYIAKENTFRGGYNSTFGGDGAPGVTWSDDRKDKAKELFQQIKEKHPNKFGNLVFDKEQKDLMSKIKLENHWRSKAVVIEGVTYKSLRDAARKLNSTVYKVKILAEGKTPDKGVAARRHAGKPYRIGNLLFPSRQAAADFYEVSIHNIDKTKRKIESKEEDKLVIESKVEKAA